MTRGETAAALARVGREVIHRGLTWGTSGNLSARTGETGFVISAAGARLDELDLDRLADCTMDGGHRPDGPRPSLEVEMHRALYAAVPAAKAIVHTSAPCTTLLACSRLRVPVEVCTDSLAYVGRVARVPYRHPGSRAL
ncbi:MAG TPA: class II aldolase/adducin family protein, partial [Candidatus Eisenbacteria bacterium]|nr:class II aldolase/adducin family protein [Candidatus Eisenbacteria bacterium]